MGLHMSFTPCDQQQQEERRNHDGYMNSSLARWKYCQPMTDMLNKSKVEQVAHKEHICISLLLKFQGSPSFMNLSNSVALAGLIAIYLYIHICTYIYTYKELNMIYNTSIHTFIHGVRMV